MMVRMRPQVPKMHDMPCIDCAVKEAMEIIDEVLHPNLDLQQEHELYWKLADLFVKEVSGGSPNYDYS